MLRSYRRPITAVIMPSLYYSGAVDETRQEIYSAFTQGLRESPKAHIERRVLCAIHKAADQTGHSDAYVARILVDMGLRAPRLALPADFLDHADSNLLASHHVPMPTPESYRDLALHWNALGELAYSSLHPAGRA